MHGAYILAYILYALNVLVNILERSCALYRAAKDDASFANTKWTSICIALFDEVMARESISPRIP